jgi:hypothetical protein
MYKASNFMFPSNKTECISFHQGLEAMLAARSYFKDMGMKGRTTFDGRGNYSGFVDSRENEQGIYCGTYVCKDTIVFKDGVRFNSKDFKQYKEVDTLMGEIVHRYGHFGHEKNNEMVKISTFVGNDIGYQVSFYLQNMEVKKFMNSWFDMDCWKLYTRFILDNILISAAESDKYDKINLGYIELHKNNFGLSQEQINLSSKKIR